MQVHPIFIILSYCQDGHFVPSTTVYTAIVCIEIYAGASIANK